MAEFIADEKGAIRGSFKIPANQKAGTHEVRVDGDMGTTALTSFTGQGTAQISEVQNIVTNTLVTYQRYDPLAQTFTFDRDVDLAAVDVWVKVKGDTPMTLDIRTCENGIPTQTILRRQRVELDEVTNVDNNKHTRIAFDPIRLQRGVEYCFILMADDAHWEVEVATLGEYDQRNDKWIKAQAFQIGTLLSSSNASTWTPHQKTDMRFTLHEAVYSTNKRSYSLGTFDLYNADLIHAQFNADRVDEETDAAIVLMMPDGRTQYRLKEDSITSLPTKITGKAEAKLELTGTSSKSPTVLTGLTLVSAGVVETGDYVTKHIPLGDNADVRVSFESRTGITSKVKAFYAIGSEWKELPLAGSVSLEDGFIERTYKLDDVSGDTIRVKLELEGTARDLPRVRKLRTVVI
ncbi:MAG: hypothetical protein GY833_12530 [Aestuariibacter sp.]|nr:hypothetical protein [Aestuariibacter sp.]|tara:strand:+ start:96319 stop:97533 length:1215 start_codon:yes stop_codon:yes gene_type:complete